MNKNYSNWEGLVVPKAYRAYAYSEAEALEIVKAIETANPSGRFTGKFYNLPYSPTLWSVSLAIKEGN